MTRKIYEERKAFAKGHTVKEMAEHFNISYRTAMAYIWKNKLEHKNEIELHRQRHTKLYSVWVGIKNRCYNPKQINWCNYGGRGIELCEEWHSFANFSNWAYNNGYSEELTIDRIDNNGNYSPENCRWTTRNRQSNNRRNNHYITFNGETKSLKDWCDELQINYCRTKARIRNGWTIENAFYGGRYEHKGIY